MKLATIVFSQLLVFTLFFASCKGGDPNIPGETQGNPLKVDIKDIYEGKVKIDKKYLAIKGIPLTGLYSYTISKKKYSATTPSEDKARNFYFPLVPPSFNPQKDELSVFVYAEPKLFNKITNSRKDFININSPEKVTYGSTTKSNKVPNIIIDVYTKPSTSGGLSFKVAPPEKRLTIKLDKIE